MSVFGGLDALVTRTVETLGYSGVGLLVALECVFPPIPSELILPLAGFVAARGDATVPGMVVAATVGSLAGSWLLYGIARAVGPQRVHGFVASHGRWLRLSERDLDRAERWFDRRAGAAVLVGRWVPLVRSLVSVPAGLRRMPLGRFSMLTAMGSLVWNAVLIGAGALLGTQWTRVAEAVDAFEIVLLAALAVVVGMVWWRRRACRRR